MPIQPYSTKCPGTRHNQIPGSRTFLKGDRSQISWSLKPSSDYHPCTSNFCTLSCHYWTTQHRRRNRLSICTHQSAFHWCIPLPQSQAVSLHQHLNLIRCKIQLAKGRCLMAWGHPLFCRIVWLGRVLCNVPVEMAGLLASGLSFSRAGLYGQKCFYVFAKKFYFFRYR